MLHRPLEPNSRRNILINISLFESEDVAGSFLQLLGSLSFESFLFFPPDQIFLP